MDCRDLSNWLHPYFDGELDLQQSLQIERHLSDCVRCKTKLTNLQVLRNIMRQPAMRYSVDEVTDRRIMKVLQRVLPPKRLPVAWGGAIAAGVAMVAIGINLSLRPPSLSVGDSVTCAEVVSDHVRSLMANHLTDVLSSDKHTVKPWFDGKLDFSPPVSDLVTEGFPLVGGRLDYLAGHPVAALVYQRRKHYINVFVWPAQDANPSLVPAGTTRDGYRVLHWQQQGMNMWVISDLNESEFTQFIKLMRDPAQQTL